MHNCCNLQSCCHRPIYLSVNYGITECLELEGYFKDHLEYYPCDDQGQAQVACRSDCLGPDPALP